MNGEQPPVVVKVGGSLLGWAGLAASLADYLVSRRSDRLILVVGGGGATEWIRGLDRVHALGQETAHALALRSLDLTAEILAAVLPELDVVNRLADLEPCWDAGRVPVFAPREFLDDDDEPGDSLPHHWDVTSDSIAARLARRTGARELVLLKSATPPAGGDLEEAARLGWVDPRFPVEARDLPRVSWRNLRGPGGGESGEFSVSVNGCGEWPDRDAGRLETRSSGQSRDRRETRSPGPGSNTA